jgi:hypothetical protein
MRNEAGNYYSDLLNKRWWMDNQLKDNLDFIIPKVAHKIAHRRSDMFIVIDGPVGCLAGDTMIRVSRASKGFLTSIKRMFNQLHNNPDKLKWLGKGMYHQWRTDIPTFVRSYNGHVIKLHKIKDVVYSGKKKVYEMILEDGKKIKATANHKIMTNNGFIELLKLDKEKDLVMCDTPRAHSINKLSFKHRDTYIGKLKYHPHKNILNRIEVSRLCYEAYLNNKTIDEYVMALMSDEEMSKTFKFIDPNIYAIHHKDMNHYNNSKENLEPLPKEEHYKLHGHYNVDNFNQGIPIYKKIISIIEIPEEQDTYDIICEEPYHNFVANDMVVHNSGKTTLSFQIARYFDRTFDLSRVVFSVDDFLNALINATPGQAVVFDEAIIVNSRSALTDFNKKVIVAMTQIRSKGLFIFFNIPSVFDLDRNLVLNRCHLLLHCYQDTFGDRGKYCAFNKEKMKLLYLKGKRLYSYGWPKSNFVGRFTEYFYLDRIEYEKKKQIEISKQGKTTKLNLWKERLRVLLKGLIRKDFFKQMLAADWEKMEMGQRITEIPKICRGFSQDTVRELIYDFDKPEKQSKIKEIAGIADTGQ